jgi:hypothetical protein
MTAKHADFDALSAFVDGEAPEWADHVAGCPRCRAAAAELRALSARVGAPADPPPPAQREAAIAAALGLAGVDAGAGAGVTRRLEPAVADRHEVPRVRPRSRWASQSWAMPAIAAVVLACVGFAGVILSSTRSTDHEATFAGPALDSKGESAVGGAPNAPVGDLGDVPDAATLRARALGLAPTVAAGGTSVATGRASSSADSGAQSSATNTGSTGAALSSGAASGGTGGSATSVPPNATSGAGGAGGAGSAGGAANVIAPNAIGTRPCEERARAREPGLGPVTYFATARQGTVPTYVLGFGAGGGPVTLLMLAQDGCAELLRSVGP